MMDGLERQKPRKDISTLQRVRFLSTKSKAAENPTDVHSGAVKCHEILPAQARTSTGHGWRRICDIRIDAAFQILPAASHDQKVRAESGEF